MSKPVSSSPLVCPDLTAFPSGPKDLDAVVRTESAALPVFQQTPLQQPPLSPQKPAHTSPAKAGLFTPPRTHHQSQLASGSPDVLATPIHPMHPSHSAEDLLTNVPLRDSRKLQKKRKHTVLITDSAEKQKDVFKSPRVAKHISKAARILLSQPDASPPSLEVQPGLHLVVKPQDQVQLGPRLFGFHRHDGRKNPYPVSGPGVLATGDSEPVKPGDLFAIAKSYKENPTGHPRAFLRTAYEKLLESSAP